MTLAASRIDTETRITGGTPSQRAMARWAIGRFEAGGLTLPPLDVRFHTARTGCYGRLGYYVDGTVDVCGVHVNQMSRRTLLHEMAHGWVESNVSPDQRARFLHLRRLRTWNDHGVDWEQRGFEHAAEIMSWALCDQGTGTQLPSVPLNSPDQLADAYKLLTGRPLPGLTAGRITPSA